MTQSTEQPVSHTMTNSAFAALVQQHVDLVYSAALRQLRDPAQAQDATQAVFILLYRKAPTHDGPIAGWLLKATWYVCRDAQRVAARRRLHERQAMADAAIAANAPETDSVWETYAPFLDEALARLKPLDRDAVILRFFQNKTNRQVGEALALSEEAARKRVDRALARLHEILSAKAAVPAALALGAVLTANAVQAAPAGVSAAVLASGGGAAATGTSVPVMVKSAAKAMMWAKLKVAAIVTGICAATLAVTTPVIISQMPAPPTVTPVVAAAPSAPALDSDPAIENAPETNNGRVRMAFWSLVVDGETYTQISAVCTQEPSKEDSYFVPLRGKSADVERTIRSALRAGRVVRFSRDPRRDIQFSSSEFGAGYFSPGSFHFSFKVPEFDDLSYRFEQHEYNLSGTYPVADGLHLTIVPNSPAVHAELDRMVGRPPASLALQYDGIVKSNETLIMAARIPREQPVYHLIAYQAFRATEEQMERVSRISNTLEWLRMGASGAKFAVDRAEEFGRQSSAKFDHVEDRWVRRMASGTTVRLLAVGRPKEFPFCWWNAGGEPINGLSWWQELRSGDDQPLAVVVAVGDDLSPLLQRPRSYQMSDYVHTVQNISFVTYGVPENRPITFGIGGGAWEDIGIVTNGQTINIRGKTAKVKIDPFSDVDCSISLNEKFPGIELGVEVTAKNGKKYQHLGDASLIDYLGDAASSWTVFVKPDEIQQVMLKMRKREMVTFEGFAAWPKVSPLAVHLETASQPVQSPASVEMFFQDLMDAARRGDRDALRSTFIVNDDSQRTAVEGFLDVLIAHEQMLAAAEKRFGVVEAMRMSRIEGLRRTMSQNWVLRGDCASAGKMTELIRVNGQWKWPLPPSAASGSMVEWIPRIQALRVKLESGEISTVKEFEQATAQIVEDITAKARRYFKEASAVKR